MGVCASVRNVPGSPAANRRRKSLGRAVFVASYRILLLVTGEGLEPSTNGLTYLIGFHRPSEGVRKLGSGTPLG